MKKLLSILLLVLFLMATFCMELTAKGKVVPLPDLVKPEGILLDNSRAFIVEGHSIYIYNLPEFKLKKKFGKKGEGPQEFMVNPQSGRPLFIDVQTDDIIISSMGKVSYFSKDGEFKREVKLSSRGEYFQPLGKDYIGRTLYPSADGKKRLKAVRMFDKEFKPVKDIVTADHHFQQGQGLEVFRECDFFAAWDNKLYCVWDTGFKITVYAPGGKKIQTIQKPYKRLAVSEELKKHVVHYLKTHPTLKEIFPFLRPIKFPEYLPAIRELRVADGKLYVFTFKEKKGDTQCMIFRENGKLLESRFIPLVKMDPLQTYPFTVKNGKLYQLVENQEDWELHINRL